MNYWIGQGFGILSTLTDISIPQFKKKWQMLIANILVNTFLLLNLVFLGQIGSGIFLFAVAIVQAIINLIHTLREKPPKKWPHKTVSYLLTLLYTTTNNAETLHAFPPQVNYTTLHQLTPSFVFRT